MYINIFFLRKLLYICDVCICDVYICVCGYIVFCLYMLNIYRKFYIYICKSYKFRKRRIGKKKIRKRKERRRGEEEEEK